MGAKSLHRVVNSHVNSYESLFCAEQLCLNSYGEYREEHDLRDSEAIMIGNLRHSLSRLLGNPACAAALSDQQLLAVLTYLLGEGAHLSDWGHSSAIEEC